MRPWHLIRAALVFCSFIGCSISFAQTASFNVSPSSGTGCAPLVVQFTSTSTGATSYYWNLGNSAVVPTTNSSPSTTYTTATTYTVTLHINSPTGPSATKTITVYPGPSISFTASPTSGCPSLPVTFTSTVTPNAPGALTYGWNYGDGVAVANASANPTHLYTASGNYPVTLSVTNGTGCTTTLPVSNVVNVFLKPSAAFSVLPGTTMCSVPAIVSFVNSAATGVSYAWTFGNGSSSGSNPTNTYTVPGIYSVSLTATNSNGCKDTVVKTSYITVLANNASFSSPAGACDSSNVSMTNTSSGVTGGTSWWFGDGDFDTGVIMHHIYTASGTYNIKMVTKIGPCYDTVIRGIVINPKPVISISHDAPCIPGSMSFTAGSSVPLTTYNWAWASGGSATGNPATHFYSGARIDTTYLIASTGAGCSDTTRMDTTFVRDWYPNVLYNNKGCAPITVTFSCTDSTPCSTIPCTAWRLTPCLPVLCQYPHKIVSFTWWYDGVFVTNAMSFSKTIPTAGGHYAVLKTVTANGCVRYDTFYVCAGLKVKPSFYAYPDTVVCVKTPVFFQNTTGDTTIKYSWYYGPSREVDSSNGAYNGYHRYLYPGSDTVMLITDVCGCYDTAIRLNYITVHPADAHFSDSVYCGPSKTVAFTDMSTGATTHYWDFGDGTTSTAQNPIHTYPGYSKYYVRHMTSNATYGCRDTCIDSVFIVNPSISFAADTTLCLGDTLKLLGNYSGLTPSAYVWKINGFIDTNNYKWTTTKDTVLPIRGFHTVTWVVYTANGRCVDSLRKTNYVLVSHPIANFGASPRLGCTPLPVLFVDSTSYTTGTQAQMRDWIFGDGGTASNNNVSTSHTYTVAGKYTVKLKVTDWIGCTDSVMKLNYIEARHPVADFYAGSTSACVGQTIYFTNMSTGASPQASLFYHWFFGDGDTSSLQTGAHAYNATGNYTVRLVVSDSTGCTDTLTIPAYIKITRPAAAFSISDTVAVCPPLIVNFTSTATNASAFYWDLGNGSSSVLANVATTYVTAGVYNVRLIVLDTNLCADTTIGHVRVLGYAGALSYSPLSGCAPLTVNFTANLSNVPRIVWDFSDGDTALVVGKTYTHTYLNPGVYVPKLIFYDGKGCSTSSTGVDTIKVDDAIAGFKVLPPCEHTPLLLVDTSHGLFSPVTSWRWDFGGGQIATGQSVPRVYPSPGKYSVTLIVTNAHGCIDTLKKDITIYPLPVITGSPDTAVCVPDAVTISAKGGITYTWSPGGSLSCTACNSPSASPTTPTSYIVTGTDSNGCANKDTVKIGIQTKTTFTVTSGGEICLGQHFQLFAGGATLYHWTPSAALDNADSSAPTATPTATTTYIATGREGSCLADTHMVKVVVNPLPTIDAGKDERVVAGNSIQLQASGTGIDHLLWKNDSALSCTGCYAPDASPRVTTTFYVTAYTAKGCTSTDSVTVRVLCDNSQLFIPNTFTPNGDGMNDYFFPRGRGLDVVSSFRVYSRWGELLFERSAMSVNDEYAGWNGTYKGQKLSPDVYVYIIEATCENGEPIKWKGDVTLMR